MTCKACSSACAHDDVPLRALGPNAMAVFDYLELRAEAESWPEAAHDPDVIDELLIRARAARRSFRVAATPALRSTRLRVARGLSDKDYEALVKELSGKDSSRTFLELVDRSLTHDAVRAVLEREGASKQRIEAVRAHAKSSGASIALRGSSLAFVDADGAVPIRKATPNANKHQPHSLLRELGRTWSRSGRGLMGPRMSAKGPVRAKEVVWGEHLAAALIHVEHLLDQDIRHLEDRCALPVAEGRDGGAVVGAIIVVVGIVLILIAECVTDPTVATVLRVIGAVLTIVGGVVLADAGVPVSVCRTDPTTGTVCGRI